MEKDKQVLLENAKQAIIDCDSNKAKEAVSKALEAGIEPYIVITEGPVPGITKVGVLFDRGQLFLPELLLAGIAMKAATAICTAQVPESKTISAKKVVIGTVEGDIHEIGKSIVITFLLANGFEVYDLGSDVPSEKFVEKVLEVKPDVVGTSALITTTMGEQKTVIEALKKAGLRDKVKIIIGGAPTNQSWADQIGADAYGENAIDAVRKIKQLTGLK